MRTRSHALFRSRTAKAGLVFIYLSAFALSFPYYFYYQGISVSDSTLTRSDFAESVGYEVYAWIRMFLAKLIPIVIVTICNAILIKTTRTKTRRISAIAVMPERMAARRQETQGRLTVMLLSISTVFVLCNIAEPFANSQIYKEMFGEDSVNEDDFYILIMVVNMLEFIAFASNFISYCIFHKHFVATLKALLLCRGTPVAPARTRQRRLGTASLNPYVINSMSTDVGRGQDSLPGNVSCIRGNVNSNNTQSSDEPGRSSQKALIFSSKTTVY